MTSMAVMPQINGYSLPAESCPEYSQPMTGEDTSKMKRSSTNLQPSNKDASLYVSDNCQNRVNRSFSKKILIKLILKFNESSAFALY